MGQTDCMRRQQNVIQNAETMRFIEGFTYKNVQRGPGNAIFFERFEQGILVHDAAARY